MNDERARAGSRPAGEDVAAEVARVRQPCERATDRNFGRPVLSLRAVDESPGVEVHLSSWPRAEEPRRQLEAAGYLVTEMEPVSAHGFALVAVDALQVRLSDTELLEVEIAAGSTLADPTLRQSVPRLVAEARASRAQLGHAQPTTVAPLGRWAAGPLGRWAAGPLGGAGVTGTLNAAERAAAVARVQRARALLTEDAEPYAAAALQVLLDRTVPELLDCIDALEDSLARRQRVDGVHTMQARVLVEVLDELGQGAVQRWDPSIVVDEIELRRDAAAKELNALKRQR